MSEGEYEKFNENKINKFVDCTLETNLFPEIIIYDIKIAFVFRLRHMKMIFSAKIEALESLKRLGELKSYKQEALLQEKLGEKDVH